MSGPFWRRYLRFWGTDVAADVDDELRFHIDSRIEDYVAAGMTPEAAHAEAMRRFGNVDRARERCHAIDQQGEQERRRADMWDALRQDLRYAVRALGRNPGFTFVAVLTLALGIGANTAIFSVVNGVLLRPLPFHEPDGLVRLFTTFRGSAAELPHSHSRTSGGPRYAMSQPEYMDYKGLANVFESAAAFTGARLTLTGIGEPERVRGIAATRDLLPVLGITPARGRNFEGDEGRQGTAPVVIVTHEFWQNRFGSDPLLLGRTLSLNGIDRRVVGILPAGTEFSRAEAFIPLFINPDSMTGRSYNYLQGVARLKTDATVEQGQRELNALTRRSVDEYPRNYPASMGYGATVITMHDEIVGDVRPALLILLGAVGLVLLIACANVANLLLARGEARQREIAVRLALGAGRKRVVRQLLTESTTLAVLGAGAGMLLAWWGVKAILAVNPDAIPRMQEIRIDGTVVMVTMALAVFTGILFGLAPAMQLVSPEMHRTLKEGSRGGSESGERHRLGRALVASEIALAVVVVIGAALLTRSFWELRNVNPGFTSDHVLTIDLSLPESRYDLQATTTFYQRLTERLGALPGVEVAAGASDLPPIASGNNWDIQIDGRAVVPGQSAPSPEVRAVTGGYFRALSIPMARGRPLGPEDRRGSMPAAVINETAARTVWPDADPIGQRVRFSRERPWVTIVGIARDVRSSGLSAPVPAEMYLSHEQLPIVALDTERTMYMVLRTTGEPMTLATPARKAVRDLDPLLAIIGIRTMTQMVDGSVAQPRFTMLLLGVFGAVALSLAAIGIYGVISYAVRRRTREIGIRMALGAQPRDVFRLVAMQGMRLALLGLAVGIVGAFFATRVMSRLLYGVSATDPLTFVATALLLASVAFVASWLPARRAVRTAPDVALRSE